MDAIDKLETEYNDLEESNSWMDVFQNLDTSEYDQVSYSNAKHPMNIKYNRYRDILPYDHTRVKLKGMNDTDYINANFVECKKADRIYILAQAPLKNTCEHFWEMIWEQNTLGIVMLNRLFEKGTQKCEMYYPNVDEDNGETTLEFGRFRLNYVSEKPFKDFSIRTIECENLEQKEKRNIYHCHFTNWPDFGEPDYPTTFLRFLNECEQLDIFNRELYGPCVVHCSAGVGRSGTFILVDSMLQILKKYGNDPPMNVFELLNEFRTYRMALVQTPQQLRFAYRAIIDGIKRGESQNWDDEDKTATSTTTTTTTNGFGYDDESSQRTTESGGATASSTNTSEQDLDDEDDDDEDEESDDEDFYEGEDNDDEDEDDDDRHKLVKQRKLRRPNTARPTKGRVTKLKLSTKSQNRIKELRMMQLKNRSGAAGDRGLNNQENLIKTAVGRVNSERAAAKLKDGKVLDSEESVEENEEESPFVRRDVQTVKVGQTREPLAEKMKQSSENKEQEATVTSSASSKRPLSEKEARIAEKVRSIKEKQNEQERRKHLLELYRPWLICGGVLIGGIVLHHIFKRIFY